MLDAIWIDELTHKGHSYLRFTATEWYKYEPGEISYIRNPEWLEELYKEEAF
jgi:hypothetical protein